ncbi:unnamed protein product, partial [Heterosigma akashiwo]
HAYEIIREQSPCRLYFDLEFDPRCNPTVDGDHLVSKWIQFVCLHLHQTYDLVVGRSDFLELDSSSDEKFSRHLICHLPSNQLFKDNLHAGKFVKHLIAEVLTSQQQHSSQPSNTTGVINRSGDRLTTSFFVKSKDGTDTCFVDLGVYTRNRCFRCYQSSKFGKKTPFELARSNTF